MEVQMYGGDAGEEGGGCGGEGDASEMFEVDFHYEFDAPKWFDLGREETPDEASGCEMWFHYAPSYPPSPLIAKIFCQGAVNVVSSGGAAGGLADGDAEMEMSDGELREDCATGRMPLQLQNGSKQGKMHPSGMPQNMHKAREQTSRRRPFFKGSTLMKPTASQLAKQNRHHQLQATSRPDSAKSTTSTDDLKDCIVQAAKRQRLEGGHICKLNGERGPDFIHKIRDKRTGNADLTAVLPRLKLTIPREPELATKQRAERLKSQRREAVHDQNPPTTTARRSHAINYQKRNPTLANAVEPNMKFQNRAVVQTSQLSKPSSRLTSSIRGNAVGMMELKPTECRQLIHNENKNDAQDKLFSFKAQPLDRKNSTGKKDGFFQQTKRISIAPKESNLSTNRRTPHNPLTELFDKLSITARANTSSNVASSASVPLLKVPTKDSKENLIKSKRL